MDSKTVEKAIVGIVIAAIALVILGTVSIPAFLAVSYRICRASHVNSYTTTLEYKRNTAEGFTSAVFLF